ncbi:hypothetical protein [Rhizobium sp. BK176]|uniref:hypothetical protein n=1 Tax=Rhizobium sp. BK176 TaxID=2587071 RepID=UPI002166F754|nr:hypothetical protein [Rhizobium sp. BK176]MCS4089395.1 hypothetical protein [Rhizobium sp. BK176]
MSAERNHLYGIRYKEGEREPFSLLAEVELSTESGSPNSVIHQTMSATICVGAFHRKTLFLTHDFELAASLVLFGVGIDFKESFYLNDFKEAFQVKGIEGREIEVFDMLSGDSVAVIADDPRLANVVKMMSCED